MLKKFITATICCAEAYDLHCRLASHLRDLTEEVKDPASGGFMKENPRERRGRLFRQALIESDPQKLSELISEICRLLQKAELRRNENDDSDCAEN